MAAGLAAYPRVLVSRLRWESFFLYGVLSTISLTLRSVASNPSENWFAAAVMVALVVTAASIALLVLLTKFVIVGNPRGLLHPLPLLGVSLVGCVRGALIAELEAGKATPNSLGVLQGVGITIVFTVVLFVGSVALVESLLSKRDQFQELFNRSTTQLLVSGFTFSPKPASEQYAQTVARLDQAISPRLDLGNSRSLTSDEIKQVSLEIQNQINGVLRPISHRLWISALGSVQHVHPWRILSDSIRTLHFSPWLVIFYQLIVGTYTVYVFTGLATVFAVMPAALGVGVLLQVAYFQLRKSSRNQSLALNSLFLILTAAMPLLAPMLLVAAEKELSNFFFATFLSGTTPLLIISTSAHHLLSKDRDIALAAVQSVNSKISRTPASRALDAENSQLASYLHNSLQSNLLRISKQLEFIAQNGNSEDVRRQMKMLRDLLDVSYDDMRASGNRGFSRLPNLIDAWAGICELSVHLNAEESFSKADEKAIVEIIEEIITNSIRYADASKMKFEVHKSEQGTELFATHNGSLRQQTGTGLGTILMEQFATRSMTISVVDGQAQLRLQIHQTASDKE